MDERPPLWVGHIVLTVAYLDDSYAFWQSIGLRPVDQSQNVAILELRGGTHLILVPGTPTPGDAPFDLMVDDVDAVHDAWEAKDLRVSAIRRDNIHDSFDLRDPDGYIVQVSNSHVVGPV